MNKLKIPELEEIKARYSPRKDWNDEEIEILITYYGQIPMTEIAKYLRRSNDSVKSKANSLGLKGL